MHFNYNAPLWYTNMYYIAISPLFSPGVIRSLLKAQFLLLNAILRYISINAIMLFSMIIRYLLYYLNRRDIILTFALQTDMWRSISSMMIKFVPIMHHGHRNVRRVRRQFDTEIHGARCIINYASQVNIDITPLRETNIISVSRPPERNPVRMLSLNDALDYG